MGKDYEKDNTLTHNFVIMKVYRGLPWWSSG